MPKVDTADFKNGLSIMLDNEIYTIVWFQHHKPGKGGAVMRTKLKNLRTGGVVDRTFGAGEKFEQAILERHPMQYLYKQDDEYVLMNPETFDQVSISAATFGSTIKYLKDGMEVLVVEHNEKILGAEVPSFVELVVADTDPGVKGDTASGGSKPATLETGAVINVPFFVNIGDKVKVDTRTDTYLERVK
ncbi:MAG TPA: elongation factor P [Chthonomonadaceae bacterium]|nr:elongation factor P [Chthonomonadaceae bacterium]